MIKMACSQCQHWFAGHLRRPLGPPVCVTCTDARAAKRRHGEVTPFDATGSSSRPRFLNRISRE